MSTTPAYRRRCEFTASPKQKEAPGVTGVYLQRGRRDRVSDWNG